jgi:hypothetical protein
MEGYGRAAYGSDSIYSRIAKDTIEIMKVADQQDLNDLL